MNCKPGDLAVIVRAVLPENIGRFVTVIRGEFDAEGWMWYCESSHPLPGAYNGRRAPGLSAFAWSNDVDLRPIRDQPGNESFVVEARKSLPRPATAKGDTITERGELA